jgi:hypothetical protein
MVRHRDVSYLSQPAGTWRTNARISGENAPGIERPETTRAESHDKRVEQGFGGIRMTTTTSWARFGRTAGIVLAVIIAHVAFFTFAASPAHAAGTSAANYEPRALTFWDGSPLGRCGGRSGDADDAGRFYTLCFLLRDTDGNGSGDTTAPALVEYSSAGVIQKLGWLPAEYWFGQNAPANYEALDVAVTPDGNTAYVTPGPNIDNLGQSPNIHPYTHQTLPNGALTGQVLRLRRGANGDWSYDASWKAGPFLLAGNYWAARRLDVDASGRVYVSTNAVVYELSPANASIVTSFGGGASTDGPGGRWIEGIDNAQGIAVDSAGASIYVVDQQHQIVQRWLRVGASDWSRDTGFLLGRPDEVGDYCDTTDHFQSPYDVGVDGAGDIYVMDTTCNRVQRFTKTGTFVQTVWQYRTNETLELSHGFAVNWQGSVMLPTEVTLLRRLDPPTRPTPVPTPKPNCIDRLAPRLLGVTAPTSSTARAVRIEVRASDDCGITHMRVLGNRLGTARWIAATSTTVALNGWNGRRTLVVQVRDKRGVAASRRITIVLALPQPTLVARSTARLAGSGCRANPMGRISDPSGYRLTDACAVISGRVLKATQTGASISAEVLLPTSIAQRIYTNAVGPVKLTVITDSSTRVTRALRTGHGVVARGALVARSDLSTVYLIPVDAIAGS